VECVDAILILTEATMNTIIDTGSELLIDRSTLDDPFLRLIVAALGRSFVKDSPWVTVNKQDLGRAYPPGNASLMLETVGSH
jgi:hypothetical protein